MFKLELLTRNEEMERKHVNTRDSSWFRRNGRSLGSDILIDELVDCRVDVRKGINVQYAREGRHLNRFHELIPLVVELTELWHFLLCTYAGTSLEPLNHRNDMRFSQIPYQYPRLILEEWNRRVTELVRVYILMNR